MSEKPHSTLQTSETVMLHPLLVALCTHVYTVNLS